MIHFTLEIRGRNSQRIRQALQIQPLFFIHFKNQLTGFSSEALDELAGYSWPDNVDELSELVESACRRAKGPVVETRDLPDQIRWAAHADAHPSQPDEPVELDELLASIEKELISRALRRCKGNKTQAARLLGLNRARFHRRVEYFGIS